MRWMSTNYWSNGRYYTCKHALLHVIIEAIYAIKRYGNFYIYKEAIKEKGPNCQPIGSGCRKCALFGN